MVGYPNFARGAKLRTADGGELNPPGKNSRAGAGDGRHGPTIGAPTGTYHTLQQQMAVLQARASTSNMVEQ